ncbi:MAG TPA: 2-C-methyl-D-erythritol 4-phosphate cytidylyltransferase [Lacibacter sp.]|nr:2-C-methyl-D-erythritol 4-phosphate cytidylyltransferase [Lacibacter sp.]HMO87670.1 2-C-methyl-D-erythritol 4-phosphate cytidylyltransferase [Lacibacter sp.]
MKTYAVIVAGGSGTRMGSVLPKQFLLVQGKPVLYHTIQAFVQAFPGIDVILVLPEEHLELGREIVDGYFDDRQIRLTAGGETRFHSVQNGLRLVQEESIVFVHDGVRCLVSGDLLQRCYNSALETGSAVPVVESRDSLRMLTEEGSEPVDRSRIRLVQTPQTFHSKILQAAFDIDYKERFTDEATVVEAFGLKVTLVPGDPSNIKITTPIDLVVAEQLMQTS